MRAEETGDLGPVGVWGRVQGRSRPTTPHPTEPGPWFLCGKQDFPSSTAACPRCRPQSGPERHSLQGEKRRPSCCGWPACAPLHGGEEETRRKVRGPFPVPGEPREMFGRSPGRSRGLDVNRTGVWGSDCLGSGSSEDKVWVRPRAVREGFLEEGTQAGYRDPRTSPGHALAPAGQADRVWLTSA